MLYWLLYQKLFPYFRPFRIFRYLTFRTAFASLTAMLIALLIGPFVIEKLREFQIGQFIREDGPKDHQKKAGTPTMGGVLICIAILVPTLLWSDLANPFVWLVMSSTLAFGAIGFADDYIKVIQRRNLGLTPSQKMGLQIVTGGAIAIALLFIRSEGIYSTHLMVPFLKRFRPDLSIHALGADSPSECARLYSLRDLRHSDHRGFQQRGEPHRRTGWAGHRLYHHRRRGAHRAYLRQRQRRLLRLPRAAAHADGQRSHGLLRGHGRRQHRLSLVQRPPGGGFHGRRGLARAWAAQSARLPW